MQQISVQDTNSASRHLSYKIFDAFLHRVNNILSIQSFPSRRVDRRILTLLCHFPATKQYPTVNRTI